MDYKFPYNKKKEQNKIEMKGSVPMNYAEVINDDIEREKNIEKAFKEKNKETNEFIKKNDKRETEKVKSKDLKKMHLEESFFEDYDDDIDENFLSNVNYDSDDLSEGNEILDEATAVLDKPETDIVYYYKKKREPLADIIMSELTIGEYPVYKKSASGKFNPTNGPCLNIADENIGVNSDSNGEYILARVGTEDELIDIEEIANKYNREFRSEFDRWARGPKYIGKIYVSEQDWDEPYIDPNARVKGA